ncbi:ROK family protein [Gimesia aquarii]|uniref:Glucokinase n=1 Tax=Gimesia aquarii TaxID=2527964 RepID=A0A517WSJ2_9PLAN|nr:ROK family protein [Gimesia aquarii]QDU08198.1 Glucokinase [Gimesia aquarii]
MSTDSINAGKQYWAGFDLGGTKMLAKIFDSEYQTLGRKRRKTKGHSGVESGLERIAQTIHQALEEANLKPEGLAGIGVGCPGPLDLKKGVIFEAPNLGWYDAPVKEVLEKEFGCPVVICNDVDAGVFGEYRFGAAKDSTSSMGIFPGTGIGGGAVYRGQLVQGSKSSCMEIGHTKVLPSGPECGCGQYGCLEVFASRLAISAAAAQAAYRGDAPKLRELAGTDLSDIRSGILAAAVQGGDESVKKIILRAAKYIGIAAGNMVHTFSPEVIVLGGGLIEAMPDLIVPAVAEATREKVMPTFKDSFKVVAAQLGDDSTVMGAAAWAQKVIQETPSLRIETKV